MSLLQAQSVSLSFGHQKIFDAISFSIEKHQKIAVIGRNGEGKSTLLKLISGLVVPEEGAIKAQKGLNIANLTQDVPETLKGRVFDVVLSGAGEVGNALIQYQSVIDKGLSDDITPLMETIDSLQGWSLVNKAETILSKMHLDGQMDIESLSGGMKRRVLLAKTLLTPPDILLLDEPTNHLDIESITWLENWIAKSNLTLLLVTHDRQFLQSTTDVIWELDRGNLSIFLGNYAYYQEKKAQALVTEQTHNQNFDKKLAAEEKWIRQGIKARRTRNEGRVRALKSLRKERLQRREQIGNLQLGAQKLKQSGKLVICAENISFKRAERTIISDFSSIVARGDKIGIVGPNGCGKTTLIQLLLGKLTPSSGNVSLGTELKVAYFDQLRGQLALDKTAVDNVGQGRTYVNAFGKEQHIIGYLQDFLFSSERANCPVKHLSGGEKNRLLLAKLFTQSANLLVLDEPTNDLDIESLEILESFLVGFQGTLIIVSHDRVFLENVVTTTWVYEGGGQFQEYLGGFRPYKPIEIVQPKAEPQKVPTQNKETLSEKERRELKAIPKKIERLETNVSDTQGRLSQMAYDDDGYKALCDELNTLEADLEILYGRWEALESKL